MKPEPEPEATERRRHATAVPDAALPGTDRRFQVLVETAPVLISIGNADGEFVYVNPSSESVLGYKPDELLGSRGFDLIHPRDLPDLVAALTRARSELGASQMVELRARHKDGSWRFMLASFTNLLHDPHLAGVVVALRDISDLKETQRELQEETRFVSSVLDTVAALVIVLEPDGTIVEFNRACQETTGYTPAEVVGRAPQFLLEPHRREELMGVFRELTAGNFPNRYENAWLTKDGELRYIEWSNTCITDASGAVEYVIGTGIDVTERRAVEAARRSLEEQLQQSQKMEAVGTLAGGIAHDFNNLLSVILNYANFLMDDLDPSDPRRADAAQIATAGEHAAQLVRRLLAFSRRDPVQPLYLDVAHVVNDMRGLLRGAVEDKAELVVEAPEELPSVLMDPGHLEQILMNLVVNARDAMPDGGLLTVRAFESTPENTTPPPGVAVDHQWVCLEVADAGTGMSEATLKQAFEPFFTTKPKGVGTGLGLSLIYRIVESAGGFIDVASVLQEGTTVRVYLPVETVPASMPEA